MTTVNSTPRTRQAGAGIAFLVAGFALGLFVATMLWSSICQAADVTVTFTPDEAQTIINDLDLATKAGGLQVAGGALQIVHKLQEAASKPIADPVPMTAPKSEEPKK